MERGTILVVDDEPNIADLVELYLGRDGFRVVKAATGEDGRRARSPTHRPRLVVLDVGLPDIDGLEVCRRLRQTSAIPVIFLTARDTEIDRVLGLELGADDYVTKPFSPAELVARVKAVLRRAEGATAAAEIVQVGRRRRSTSAAARCASTTTPVAFTTKEFDLLQLPRRAARARAQPPADPRRRVGLRLVRRRAHRRRAHRAGAQEARRRGPHRHRARRRVPARADVSDASRSRSARGSSPRWSLAVGRRARARRDVATYGLVRRALQRARARRTCAATAQLDRSSRRSRRSRATSRARPALQRFRADLRVGLRITDLQAVLVAPDGTVVDRRTYQRSRCPTASRPTSQPSQLLAGEEVSGRRGNTVFLAIPTRTRRPPAARRDRDRPGRD